MIKKLITSFLMLACITHLSYAHFSEKLCPTTTQLNTVFRYAAYQHCQNLLKRCPKQPNTPLPNTKCIESLTHQPACQQLNTLAQAAQGELAFVKVAPMKATPLYLVTSESIADGGRSYSILTPDRHLVSLNAFTSIFSDAVYSEMRSAPTIKKLHNGHYQLVSIFSLAKGCRACAALGNIDLSVLFTAKGHCIAGAESIVNITPTHKS